MHVHFAGYFDRPWECLLMQDSVRPVMLPLPEGASPYCSFSSLGCSCNPAPECRVSDPSCCSCRPGSADVSANSGRPERSSGTKEAFCSKSSEHSGFFSLATWWWSRSTSLGSVRNAFRSDYLSLEILKAAWKC